MYWAVLGGVNSYLSVYSAISSMVTIEQPTKQPGDPIASLLLTSVRRQSFAYRLGQDYYTQNLLATNNLTERWQAMGPGAISYRSRGQEGRGQEAQLVSLQPQHLQGLGGQYWRLRRGVRSYAQCGCNVLAKF